MSTVKVAMVMVVTMTAVIVNSGDGKVRMVRMVAMVVVIVTEMVVMSTSMKCKYI